MVDSTALADELDAESFRALMEHYFQAADEVVARHGGASRSSSGGGRVSAKCGLVWLVRAGRLSRVEWSGQARLPVIMWGRSP
jgi:class 3 adenylate cyclase